MSKPKNDDFNLAENCKVIQKIVPVKNPDSLEMTPSMNQQAKEKTTFLKKLSVGERATNDWLTPKASASIRTKHLAQLTTYGPIGSNLVPMRSRFGTIGRVFLIGNPRDAK